MTRCGRTFLVVAALVCAGLLSAGSVVRGDEGYKYERGGVLFYASFDGTRDAVAVGDGKVELVEGGGGLTADGFDSIRRSALKTGDGLGYLEFAGPNNVLSESGTIEFWIRPGNWSHNDGHRHTFVEIIGEGGGALTYYLGSDDVEVFLVRAPAAQEQKHWDDKVPGVVNTAYGSGAIEGVYRQLFLIWDKDKGVRCYHAYVPDPDRKEAIHGSGQHFGSVPLFGKPVLIRIGDFGGEKDRNAFSYIDELYIYNRALSFEECVWVNKNAFSRSAGMDIPSNFAQPKVTVLPDPAHSRLEVRIDSGHLDAEVHGSVRLEPTAGTLPATIAPDTRRYGTAWIAYSDLPSGDYRVSAEIADAQGASLGTAEAVLTVPEDPGRWLGNTIGISDSPPSPFEPLQADRGSVRVWQRRYTLGSLGLPEKIESMGHSLLSAPVELRLLDEDKTVIPWKEKAGNVRKSNAVEADIQGVSSAGIVELEWRCHAEYDGMLRYDFAMPEGSSAGGLQLRIPVKSSLATLYYTDVYMNGWRGRLPDGPGIIWSAGSLPYLWYGNEEIGICAFQEDDRGWIQRSSKGLRLERDGEQTVLVYDLAPDKFELEKPWQFTFGLQATPVRPRPKDWRRWQAVSMREEATIHYAVESPGQLYFTLPSPRNPQDFKGFIQAWHAQGKKVVPYSGLNFVSPEVPEYLWFHREWAYEGGGGKMDGEYPTYAYVRMTPSWMDFVVWKNVQLLEEYGYDGIYVDFGGAHFPSFAPHLGLGYERDGQPVASMPIFRTREVYKRIYTAFKERSPENILIAHISSVVHVPIVAFCDIWLDGESNWKGVLRDNYLDIFPLDVLRAEFMCHATGGIPWFLPQWTNGQVPDKDVFQRRPDGGVDVVSAEKAHHLFGLGLLHDFSFTLACGQGNPEATKEFYDVLDSFGVADAQFFGYWKNSDLIGGQTEEIKASAYRKPEGGALVVAYNVTRQSRSADLAVDWERLKSKGVLSVMDAYTEKPIEVSGKSVTIEVPPLNHRLLRIK